MALVNALYDNARERLAKALLNWPTLNLVMNAWGGDPEASFNPAHLTQSALGTPLATSQPILLPSVAAGGYCRSSYANFAVIPVGGTVQFLTLHEDLATPASRPTIAYLADVAGCPFVPNGLSYLVKPDWLFAQGWFRA